jgi:hypothetical protein
MSTYTVKLKVNLKVGVSTILQKGQRYSGPLEELPNFIQRIIKEDNPKIAEILKTGGIIEVPEVVVPAEGVVADIPAEVPPTDEFVDFIVDVVPDVAPVVNEKSNEKSKDEPTKSESSKKPGISRRAKKA